MRSLGFLCVAPYWLENGARVGGWGQGYFLKAARKRFPKSNWRQVMEPISSSNHWDNKAH